ncbi:unnamed protein product, partial [Ixodes hexagonus]
AANHEDLRSEEAARSAPPDQQQLPEDHEKGQGSLSPLSPSLDTLRGLDRRTLIAEQKSDATLKALPDGYKEGVARRNISFYTKSGLLCRKYRDKKGRDFDQLVIPLRFREASRPPTTGVDEVARGRTHGQNRKMSAWKGGGSLLGTRDWPGTSAPFRSQNRGRSRVPTTDDKEG